MKNSDDDDDDDENLDCRRMQWFDHRQLAMARSMEDNMMLSHRRLEMELLKAIQQNAKSETNQN